MAINQDFIYGDYIEDISLCDAIVAKFSESGTAYKGTVGDDTFRPDLKISTDYQFVEYPDLLNLYLVQLKKLVDKYIEKYPSCNLYKPWNIVEHVNIQHYAPTEGFFGWHTERSGMGNNRHLAFMTYLNDVEDAGETEWMNQGLKVKPKKGMTMLWPVDWTHTHRGIPSPTQDKWITTGWYSYVG
jgi:hypothetical protein